MRRDPESTYSIVPSMVPANFAPPLGSVKMLLQTRWKIDKRISAEYYSASK